MRTNNVFIVYILILLAFIMCSCTKESKKAIPPEENTTLNIESNGETASNTEYSHNDDIKANKVTEETVKTSDYKYKALLEKYISYMKKEHAEIFENSDKCRFYLQDIYGGGMPEMAACILYESGYTIEYFFSEKENGDILYMGFIPLSEDDKLYSDGRDYFIISHRFAEGNNNGIRYTDIYNLNEDIWPNIVGDLSEYSNSSADEFIQNTQLTFCRFDEYFEADNDIPAEVYAEDFYYEDTGTYEAYLFSPEILELTDSELSEYRVPYNIGIRHYLAKREEYLAVKEKLGNMMTEADIISEIDSEWLETENID